jgi:anti-sigma factor RsiW
VTHPSFEALDAHLDGELVAADAREIEAHIAQCPECTRFRAGRLALREGLRAHVPTFQASDELRRRVRATLETAAPTPTRPSRRVSQQGWWRPLALAASLAVVALGSWNLALRRASGERLADDVLASHIRSLMPGHLTDVLSSDQHTVKPWFNGKLDFSPPVYDFAEQGYPLLGGRLDYMDGRAVAALVYGRRKHFINVFLWPVTRSPSGAPRTRDRQGYHLLHWNATDYAYWFVSDLGPAELNEFAHLVEQAARKT